MGVCLCRSEQSVCLVYVIRKRRIETWRKERMERLRHATSVLSTWVKDCKCNTVGGNQQVQELKMRPKAQHGGPPGWLEESDPAGCDFYVMEVHAACPDGPHHGLGLIYY
jgi:hypothetical protein